MEMRIFDAAAETLPKECFEVKPDLAIVLGSGWGDALKRDRDICRIGYAQIPGMGAAAVEGHAGEFLMYEYAGKRIAAFSGRRHWYEGVGWESVVMPIELLRRMGGEMVLLTNASGCMNPALRPGDFVIIRDHINTISLNPLIGAHHREWGERFPDMSEVYAQELRRKLGDAAKKEKLRVMEGIYAFTPGPVYETPAEVRAYNHMGADIVGMSTVPEAVFARACGINVAGLSLVTNYATGISSRPLGHEEVLATSREAKGVMARLLDNFIIGL